MSFGAINQQSSAYRQGVVLGLTMAEIMLLLVFSLLIGVGVTLSKERDKRLAVERKLSDVHADDVASTALLKDLREKFGLEGRLNQTAPDASPEKIDAFWRRLVQNDAAVQALEKEGVSSQDIGQSAAFLAEADRLRKEGVEAKDLQDSVTWARQMRQALAARGLTDQTPERVATLAQKGLEAPEQPKASPGEGHRWPPIINLSEADGYFFASGKADLAPEFDEKLHGSVTDALLAIAKDFDVDVIEVVGHTDEQPLEPAPSNLDREIPGYLRGRAISGLRPADNAGLGMMRALSVVTALESDPRLQRFRILPLSAAQLIDTQEHLTKGDNNSDVKERRRIEIRMRKSAHSTQ
jgi:flagellar motor protein MotB